MANERMSVLRERRKGNRGREKERQTNKWESGQTTKRLDEQTKNERSNEIDEWQDKEQRNETNKNKKKKEECTKGRCGLCHAALQIVGLGSKGSMCLNSILHHTVPVKHECRPATGPKYSSKPLRYQTIHDDQN